MNAADAERFLAPTLADRKLSGGEKAALAAWLAENAATPQLNGVVRHAAFDLARRSAGDPATTQLMDWLEDVMRVVAPAPTSAGSGGGAGGDTVAFFAPGEACLRHIVRRVTECRRTMDLCVFTVTDDRISHPVIDAHRRGVKVRVISDNEKATDLGSDVHKFREAGIPVKLDDARGPAEHGINGHMHHKFAIFDAARLLNGSYNWTRGAADVNYENVVDAADPKLIATFAAEFERLWARF